MYAILLANALVPFINKVTQPRVFGVRRADAAPGTASGSAPSDAKEVSR
jgi:hypothetical protein